MLGQTDKLRPSGGAMPQPPLPPSPPIQLVPTPLPTALASLLCAACRVAELVQPAFGLGLVGARPAGPTPTSASRDDLPCTDGPSGRGNGKGGVEDGWWRNAGDVGRYYKRGVRLGYELNYARCILERLQKALARERAADVQLEAEREEMVLARDVAAVLGAGAVVLDYLERALVRLTELYEEERENAGVGTGEKTWSGGRKGYEERWKDAKENKVMRWLRQEARSEVWEMMAGLKDFGMGCWFLSTILESSSEHDVANSRESLKGAVAAILGQDNVLAREVKTLYPEPEPAVATPVQPGSGTEIRIYHPSTPNPDEGVGIACNIDDSEDSDHSDSEAGPPTPSSSEFPFPDTFLEGRLATLADYSNLKTILIPITQVVSNGQPDAPEPTPSSNNRISATVTETPEPPTPQRSPTPTPCSPARLKVITITTSGVDIAPLPQDIERLSLVQPTPDAAQGVSADTIFQLPEVTNQAILDFFRRAVKVSRLSRYFVNGNLSECDKHGPSQREKIKELGPKKFRELCTDLYDELVRRNVEDRNRNSDLMGRGPERRVRFDEHGRFEGQRVHARRRLQGLSDRQMVSFITVVMAELERRSPSPEWTRIVEDLRDGVSRVSTSGKIMPASMSAVEGGRWPSNVVWDVPGADEETTRKVNPGLL
ncbi:hypothetical protein VTI74DRAFT_1974 [Chaetomium olivicolor]